MPDAFSPFSTYGQFRSPRLAEMEATPAGEVYWARVTIPPAAPPAFRRRRDRRPGLPRAARNPTGPSVDPAVDPGSIEPGINRAIIDELPAEGVGKELAACAAIVRRKAAAPAPCSPDLVDLPRQADRRPGARAGWGWAELIGIPAFWVDLIHHAGREEEASMDGATLVDGSSRACVDAVEHGGLSRRQAAERFGVGVST